MSLPHVVIVGAGPAGLAAAERLAQAGGVAVTIVERMPTPARKFLLAGRGGLNLTHSEPLPGFLRHYGGSAAEIVADAIGRYTPLALRDWAADLGAPTFVGSSGRVFPESFKASPLARAWLSRLERRGVRLLSRTRWTGFGPDDSLALERAGERSTLAADATILALGGASWPRLGSDGAWTAILAASGVAVAPLAPMNAGVEIAWSDVFRQRFAGMPLKRIAIGVGAPADPAAVTEAIITAQGLEGTGIYARSAEIGEALERGGAVALHLDLRPDLARDALAERIAAAPKGRTLTERLRRAGLSAPAIGLLREAGPLPAEPAGIAARAKECILTIERMRPIERAISTRGGILADALDETLMLRALPGVFAAGEMLDWHAPTGGYLLQGCFATGRAAAEGVLARLAGGA
ncbi:TIGR03862 family flavoprotein [Salinarimonas ramus]|uniref:NAD(FAD)-utilizing dehydrogenase n=1 Tax=Salinarimonas ramus TaxID=690164 RepID=A0A917V6A0_9HYPH|nr:TIGR03862 family flavoprotein [Salinarimonas ramus]GGK43955.1 NAD(FAD)-utilizing dehydrogenase [Salinarimonas ramus]